MRHFPPLPVQLRRSSLTTRLGLSFGATVALVLVGVSGAMYGELAHELQEREEAELRADLQLQRSMLADQAGLRPASRWQSEWQEHRNSYDRFAWQLIGTDGRVRAASPNAAAFVQALAHVGRPPRRVLLTDSIRLERGAGAVPRGVLDVSHDRQVLDAYRNRLVGVVFCAIVLSTGLCWVLARRGLAPLYAIDARVARIGTEQLHCRIADQAWPAELHQLATVFDQVLARLARSFEQLARFSSDLAHEFRSPINSLVTAASVTLARPRTLAEYQETLGVVVDEGTRLSRMVASLLFLARVDNGLQVLRREPVSLAEEFRKLTAFFDIVAEDSGIVLESNGSAVLDADPALLQSALSKLLMNALHYTARGGTVRLLASRQAGAVLIAVADDGAGIAAEHLPFVFERFYRADPSRSSSESNGLGLAVVRSIMELHGGTIEVASTPGKGTRFTLRFPTGPSTGSLHPAPNEHSLA